MSVKSLQTRLEHSEQKSAKVEHTVKRLTKERDSAAEQLAAAYLTQKELEAENETFRNDIQLLHAQIQELQSENRRHIREREQLLAELDMSHTRHETETHQREAELKRNVNKAERALEAENRNLRETLGQMQAQFEEGTRQLTHKESKALRAAQKAQADRQQLEEEKQHLLTELANAKAEREAEMKRWNREQKRLETRVQNHEDTIHDLQDAVPDNANKTLRQELAALREEMAAMKADRDYETANGTVRERELERQLQQTQAEHEQASLEWVHKEDLLRAELEEEREKSHRISNAPLKSKARPENSRGRSRSKSAHHRRQSSINIRRTSAPVTAPPIEAEEAISESESTTDLSPFLAKQRKSFSHSKPAATSVPVGDDITYLSPIQTQDVREIRRKLEEERLKRRGVYAHRPLQSSEDPMMSGALPKKSSMKDLTGRSIASGKTSTVAEDSDSSLLESGNEGRIPVRSTSKSSRRRRASGFTEMTSAFILPDITLPRLPQPQAHIKDTNDRPALSAAAREVLSSLAPSHDIKNCTICARITSSNVNDAIKLSPIIPVSSRNQDNPDATLRPTQPAVSALAIVLKGLYDEHAHLVLRLHEQERKLADLDPAGSKRVRAAVHEAIAGINEAIKLKAGQIYALFDVVEAHKGELTPAEAEEVERTLDGVRSAAVGAGVGGLRGMAARGAKKVVVESFHDSEDRVYGHGDDDEEGEMTWEGLTGTGSVRSRSRSRGRSVTGRVV